VPLVFHERGYRFHFYSDEGDPREPIHVHIRKGRDNAKFWLHPEVTLAYNRGFSPRELGDFLRLIEARKDEVERAWNDHFA